MQFLNRSAMAMFAVISMVACSSGNQKVPVADAGSDTPVCLTGTERCPCYANNTCNAGLTCASLLCVNLGVVSTGGGTGVAATGGGTGAAATGGGGSAAGSSTGAGGVSTGGASEIGSGGAGLGGATGSGGVAVTGGVATGGATATGGAVATGGPSATGGAVAIGGSKATGGAISSGGIRATGGAGVGGATATAGTGGDTGGPVILSLSTNVTSMVPSDTLIVTVVVTHPGGIAQVVGGTLSDPPAGGTYGAFGVSTIGGAYSLTLTLAQIGTVRSTTTPAGGADRTFRAQFYDQAGHSTTKDFTIHLGCPNADWALCSQKCVDFTALATCGACDHDCTKLVDDLPLVSATPTCSKGKCQNIEWLIPSTPATCVDECAKHNLSCGGAQVRFGPCDPQAITCATMPAASASCGVYSYSRCFCQEQ